MAPGPNLEARARAARYAVLPAGVLTGHTADDQAETVLLNLVRGAGLDGLAGMAPEGRPLLALRRHETRALCAALGLDPVADPSNDDPGLRRNRVRHELLPLLDGVADRDVVPVIARQADLARADATALDELAAGLDPADARALAAAPPALARRAVRRWLRARRAGRRRAPPAVGGDGRAGAGRGPRRGRGLRAARWLAGRPDRRPPPPRASAPARRPSSGRSLRFGVSHRAVTR